MQPNPGPAGSNAWPGPYRQPLPPPAPGASSQAITALVLAIIGFMLCGCFTSIPAIFIARAELRAIEAGQSPAAGRTLAQIAFWMGIADVALIGIVFALYVVLIAFGVVTSFALRP